MPPISPTQGMIKPQNDSKFQLCTPHRVWIWGSAALKAANPTEKQGNARFSLLLDPMAQSVWWLGEEGGKKESLLLPCLCFDHTNKKTSFSFVSFCINEIELEFGMGLGGRSTRKC